MMGGAAMAGLTDPDRIWNEAAGRLRAEIGEGPFSSYIAPSAVRGGPPITPPAGLGGVLAGGSRGA